MFSFPRGQELPALCPVTEKKEQKQFSEDEDEEKSLTDAELLKQDTVKVGTCTCICCGSILVLVELKLFFL